MCVFGLRLKEIKKNLKLYYGKTTALKEKFQHKCGAIDNRRSPPEVNTSTPGRVHSWQDVGTTTTIPRKKQKRRRRGENLCRL